MFRRTEIILALLLSVFVHGVVLAASAYLATPSKIPLEPKRLTMRMLKIEEHSKEVTEPKKKKAPQPKQVVKKKPAPKKVIPKKVVKQVVTPTSVPKVKPVREEVAKVVRAAEVQALQQKAKADYSQVVVAWLEQHRRYPTIARRRNQEGVGQIEIVLAKTGALVEVRLLKETGKRALDRELLQMARRAQPFPKFPKNLDKERLSFTIPIEFKLR